MRISMAHVLSTVALLAATSATAQTDHAQTNEPPWLIPPGQEAAVVRLLAPYFEAAHVPRIATVQIERAVVRATLETGSTAPVVLELQHADDDGLLPVSLPPGARLLAGSVGLDLRVVALDPGPPDTVRDAVLRQVADRIVQNRLEASTFLWSPNQRKEIRAKELLRFANLPGKTPGRRLTHRGGLTARERTAVSWAAVCVGLLGGLVLGVRRRRAGQLRLSK